MVITSYTYFTVSFYPTKTLKPYVGAGLNYTIFYGVKSGVVKDVEYKNNVGFALQDWCRLYFCKW